MPPRAVLLFQDETILRLLPELRRAWSLRGEQARVSITGQNAKCVLWGTLNLRTGHCIVARSATLHQRYFQQFLGLLRRACPGRQIWLLLDKGSWHTAPQSRALARSLDIVPVWLPKQCPELNAMDQLFRELKGSISANYQFKNIEAHADSAQTWILSLSQAETLRKAGVRSKDFWLRAFVT
jgi:DDE superfamily endonuclease